MGHCSYGLVLKLHFKYSVSFHVMSRSGYNIGLVIFFLLSLSKQKDGPPPVDYNKQVTSLFMKTVVIWDVMPYSFVDM